MELICTSRPYFLHSYLPEENCWLMRNRSQRNDSVFGTTLWNSLKFSESKIFIAWSILNADHNSSVWLFYCRFIFLQCARWCTYTAVFGKMSRSYLKASCASKRRTTALIQRWKCLKEGSNIPYSENYGTKSFRLNCSSVLFKLQNIAGVVSWNGCTQKCVTKLWL